MKANLNDELKVLVKEFALLTTLSTLLKLVLEVRRGLEELAGSPIVLRQSIYTIRALEVVNKQCDQKLVEILDIIKLITDQNE